ncbi:MAG: M24 family metallopeptidase [Ignavibacteria bacterium]|nr:M24 family metallopeptidase [Ignavibacteria bacterium]
MKDIDVWLDERSSVVVLHHLSFANVRVSRSPIQQMKEIKNSVELEGFRQCHFRDCTSVCQTFEWLKKNMENDVLNVTEVDVAIYLESRQREQTNFISIAFDTISASATNTALIEYSPFAVKTKKIIVRDLYYLDAGANYLDGTTDMTRTIQFGKATGEQIKCYILLLRAILSIEMTKFTSDDNLNGFHIYSLLRSHLSSVNDSNEHLSFGHGVSH